MVSDCQYLRAYNLQKQLCAMFATFLLGNHHDRFAVTAYEAGNDDVVGHIPRKLSRLSTLFLEHRGSIKGSIIGARRHSREHSECSQGIWCATFVRVRMNDGLVNGRIRCMRLTVQVRPRNHHGQ